LEHAQVHYRQAPTLRVIHARIAVNPELDFFGQLAIGVLWRGHQRWESPAGP
jgi:hypothetical protein